MSRIQPRARLATISATSSVTVRTPSSMAASNTTCCGGAAASAARHCTARTVKWARRSSNNCSARRSSIACAHGDVGRDELAQDGLVPRLGALAQQKPAIENGAGRDRGLGGELGVAEHAVLGDEPEVSQHAAAPHRRAQPRLGALHVDHAGALHRAMPSAKRSSVSLDSTARLSTEPMRTASSSPT
ncbi:hypothetical protein [Tamaricihabitans halophyticus]|uniref:hypothetical protein n=1 Tax=Tamaricihabitans halophyticus TaxID=1262583 RepID=UPI001050B337|nr:hypothetical protein [Tamaricihabitans halophyticus]